MNLETTLKLDEVVTATNVADLLTEKDLVDIGLEVHKDFEADLLSRNEWERRTEESMKLALQVVEAKNFPWPNASNIKFPLITIAALQFHARAYPALITSETPVKCRIMGEDKTGEKTARARRVEAHMSYQVLEEDEDWEAETDKVLITQPIIGCAFKKTYFDPIKNHNISENVLAKDLVVNYWTKSLDTAPRITQILYFSSNDVYERVARGLWHELKETKTNQPLGDNLKNAQDKAQGMSMPESKDSSTPYEILEQHRYLDLDDDGYQEPYIVYVRRDTKQVLRIVARFFTNSISYKGKKVLSIVPERYFTKYPFIPSPDGGFYDLGFGVLLGPLNESINTIVNQLVDAGTMANTAGGFFSRGIKMRGGNYSFAPLEWKHVDTTGDDLRKGIMPLPVREPSQVLFTLLNLLINYGERIGGSVDVLSGVSPGQNTPAETSRNSVEQGMKIFSGIFKRTFRSLKDEFKKLYRLNQLYLDEEVSFDTDGQGVNKVLWQDYQNPNRDIVPAADPNIISDSARMMQASMIAERAMKVPGYNKYEVEKIFLKAMKISGIDQIYPDPKGPNAVPPPINPKVQVEQMKMQAQQMQGQLDFKLGLMQLMQKAEEAQAKIKLMEAQAIQAIADANGVETGHNIAMLNAQIAAQKHQRDGVLSAIEVMLKATELKHEMSQAAAKPDGVQTKP